MASREVEEWIWISGRDLAAMSEVGNARPKVASHRFWEPRVDILEEEHRFLLKAELPGVRADQIQLVYSPERHAVVLQGQRDGDVDETDCVGVLQIEILYGQFFREIRLPDAAIDASGIRAHFRNGFLLVMIPKMERVVVSRTLTIRRI